MADSTIERPDDVDTRTTALYGVPLGPADGVQHVTAVFADATAPKRAFRVLRIGHYAPVSETDAFVLAFARGRVESVLTTGSVLRAEPDLRFEIASEPKMRAALDGWRARAGLRRRVTWLVLTRGDDLPVDHPAFRGEGPMIVWTTTASAARLRSALPSHVEVVGQYAPSARGALAHLRGERGMRSVSVEAGPRVASAYYGDPPLVDELLLSVFEGAVEERAKGDALFDEATLRRVMREERDATRVHEPSGAWAFSRWLRR